MRYEDYQETIFLLLRLGMGWDLSKCLQWWVTPNPNFGSITLDPSGLVRADRGHKVLRFVVSQIDSNLPPEKSSSSENSA